MSDMKASNTTQSLEPKLNIKLPTAPVEAADVVIDESSLRIQAEKVKLQKEILELQKLEEDLEVARLNKKKLKYDSEEIDAKRAKRAMSHESVESSIRYQTEDRQRHEEACNHRKGGASESLLGGAPSTGDSAQFAMIQHTFTSGVIFRMCLRCGRTWFPQDPDYKWAMSRPTKNSPSSGSPSPGLTRFPENVRRVSEIPHRVIQNQNLQFNDPDGC